MRSGSPTAQRNFNPDVAIDVPQYQLMKSVGHSTMTLVDSFKHDGQRRSPRMVSALVHELRKYPAADNDSVIRSAGRSDNERRSPMRISRREFVASVTASGIALSMSRLAIAEEPSFAERETLPGRRR